MGGLGLGAGVRQVIEQARRDQLIVHAGNMAYKALFALFPALLAMLWLLNVVQARPLLDALLDVIGTAMPEQAAEAIRQEMTNAPGHTRGARNLTALLLILVALWALSSLMRATMRALNAMYAVEDTRPLWKRYAISLLLAIAAAGLLFGALALAVSGERIARWLGERSDTSLLSRWSWMIVQWPVLLALVLCAFSLVYYFAPDVQQRFRWIRTGTVIAGLLWLLFAILYSLFVNNYADYSRFYGAVAGIAVLMVHAYATSFIVLIGAEINQIIEMHDPEGKNEGDKVPA
jgi:membrane protein